MHNLNLFFLNKVLLKFFNKLILLLFFKRIISKQIEDISEYMHFSKKKSISLAKIKNTDFEDNLWNSKKRENIDDYREYYSQNIHYLERQDYYNLNHLNLLSEFRYLKTNANILDYGCGTAALSLKAKKKRIDLNLFLADIPEAITKDYVFWRFKKYNLDFVWIDIPKDEKITQPFRYDLIRCHDVLEHSFYPLKIIKYFYNNLKDDGYLSFDYIKSDKIEKEVTKESQDSRKEFMDFVNKKFEFIYSFRNKYVVKKKK